MIELFQYFLAFSIQHSSLCAILALRVNWCTILLADLLEKSFWLKFTMHGEQPVIMLVTTVTMFYYWQLLKKNLSNPQITTLLLALRCQYYLPKQWKSALLPKMLHLIEQHINKDCTFISHAGRHDTLWQCCFSIIQMCYKTMFPQFFLNGVLTINTNFQYAWKIHHDKLQFCVCKCICIRMLKIRPQPSLMQTHLLIAQSCSHYSYQNSYIVNKYTEWCRQISIHRS